jgi:flagellar basal body-associated protein FliL
LFSCPAFDTGREFMSLLWIILIIVLVLVLLGFFGRGRW